VSGERSNWIVFDCPACGKPVKMPDAARGTPKPCPVCGEPISAGKIEGQGTFIHALPPERHIAPAPRFRDATDAEWQPSHPERKGLQFHSALGRIGQEVALSNDEDQARRQHRRARIRQRTAAASAPEWERDGAKHRRRRRRHAWIGLTAVVAAAAGLAVAVVVFLARPSGDGGRGGAAASLLAAATAGAGEGGSPTAARLTEAEYAELRRVVGAFVSAGSPEEQLRWVRHPERVSRPLAEHFRDHPSTAPRLVSFTPRLELVGAGDLFCGYAELGDYTSRFVVLERTGPGTFLIDWETYVGWCEVPWEALPIQRPKEPVLLRARLKSDSYFNGSFKDANRFACFRLSPLDDSAAVYGYVELANPLFATLSTKTRFNRNVLGVLRIRYPEGATAGDQVEITEWICDGWVLRAAPPPADSPAAPPPALE
jgi:hypothetical protein